MMTRQKSSYDGRRRCVPTGCARVFRRAAAPGRLMSSSSIAPPSHSNSVYYPVIRANVLLLLWIYIFAWFSPQKFVYICCLEQIIIDHPPVSTLLGIFHCTATTQTKLKNLSTKSNTTTNSCVRPSQLTDGLMPESISTTSHPHRFEIMMNEFRKSGCKINKYRKKLEREENLLYTSNWILKYSNRQWFSDDSLDENEN
jgi:hypothetical protein